ncbi:MAG: restriction endonuclease subunit S [Prevotella sp.]
MKRYESYKDSGVKWLGEIPGHWEVRRLKYSCKLVNNKTVKKLPYIELDNIESKSGKLISYSSNEPESICNAFEKGDILFCKLRPYLAKCIITEIEGKCSSELLVLRKFIGENQLLKYILLSYKLVEIINASTYGAKMPRASWNFIGNCIVPIPNVMEQKAIVDYINSVTSKIDEAISQQQKMIDLLNERKQIIIQNAVTKGLDPNVKMKDSGVEWIGEIPEDWEVMKLRRISKIYTGKTPSTSNQKYFNCEDINWFTPGDFEGVELSISKRKISNIAIKDKESFLYPKNSIYMIGIGGTIGKVAFCNSQASCNQQINVIVLNKNANYKFITFLLQNSNSEILKNANFSTLPIINQQKTGDIKILLPNIKEQLQIVEYIGNEVMPINSSISQCEKMISLLQERKQIIINDVVTGKVKVV